MESAWHSVSITNSFDSSHAQPRSTSKLPRRDCLQQWQYALPPINGQALVIDSAHLIPCADESSVHIVQSVRFLPDYGRSPGSHGTSSKQADRRTRASAAISVSALAFRMDAVLHQH